MDTMGSPARGQCERHGCGQLVRCRLDEVVVETQDARRHAQRVRQDAGQDEVDRMKLIFEGGDDTEIAAAASDAPEQVLILLRDSPSAAGRRRSRRRRISGCRRRVHSGR